MHRNRQGIAARAYEGIPTDNLDRRFQTGGVLPVRRAESATVKDVQENLPEFVTVSMVHMADQIGNLARTLANQVTLVDEYNSGSNGVAASVTQVTLPPGLETKPEKITSVLVTGPVSTAFTLQLGDRYWNTLATNAQGFFLLGPLGMLLTRTDPRVLTGASAGNWTLELMGVADQRFTS